MKEKKIQVFVSSTYTDLIEERQAAVEAILSSGNIPAGMELFSATDESQMTIIKRWIDESDVYMLILGGRYGSIESKSGKSYTQLEYEYAVEKNKPLFAVILNENFIDEKVKQSGKSILENENNKELKEFTNLVKTKMVKFCDDKKDIKIAIHETLSEFAYRKDLIGWIRGDNSVNSNLLADEIARLTRENNDLRTKQTSQLETKYNGLSYAEMKRLLLNEATTPDKFGVNGNLFDYLIFIGSFLTSSLYTTDSSTTKNLKLLKTLKIIITGVSVNDFQFTNDGHNFYLKSLLDEDN